MPASDLPRPHSNEWYDALAKVQKGYYYPWKSVKGQGNGEDAFMALVTRHCTPETRVLEVGCGHGEVALELAPLCKHIIAYDRVAAYIELAEAKAAAKKHENLSYLCHDALDSVNHRTRLPAEDHSIDLIISRRGPLHWLEDARRVGHPGTVMIQLCPMEEPIPGWTDKLPRILHYENCGRFTGTGSIHQSVSNRLNQNGFTLHSGWSFDVPEIFEQPEELYKVLTWGLPKDRVPPFEDVLHRLQYIFEHNAEHGGIVLRHCRYLWKAVI